MQTSDVLSIVRYVAAFGGGFLVKTGHINPAELETLSGIALGIASILLSQIARAKKRKAARLAAPDHTDL
jgi:hypothetical protein